MRWTAEMQAAENAGDAGVGGAGGGTAAGLACPAPARAAELLGEPSCAEHVESVDGEGSLDTEASECCYEVTLKAQSCETEKP